MKASCSSSSLSPWEAHQGTAVTQAEHGALRVQMLDCYSRSTRECLTLAIPVRDLTVSQEGATLTSYRVIWSHMTLLVTLHLSLAQPKGWGGKMPGSFLVCFPAACSKRSGCLQVPQGKEGCEWGVTEPSSQEDMPASFPSLWNVNDTRKWVLLGVPMPSW